MSLNLWQLLYFYLMGLFLALLEIEIEGPHGWAAKLPTKRFHFRWWYQKFGKEITGYHLLLQGFLLLMFHLPLVLMRQFSWELEILILAQFLFFMTYWDFLWFVLNPNFRLKNFKLGGIPWHTKWLLGMPLDYWLGIIGGLFLPVIFFGWGLFLIQLSYLLVYAVFTLITIVIYYLIFPSRL